METLIPIGIFQRTLINKSYFGSMGLLCPLLYVIFIIYCLNGALLFYSKKTLLKSIAYLKNYTYGTINFSIQM